MGSEMCIRDRDYFFSEVDKKRSGVPPKTRSLHVQRHVRRSFSVPLLSQTSRVTAPRFEPSDVSRTSQSVPLDFAQFIFGMLFTMELGVRFAVVGQPGGAGAPAPAVVWSSYAVMRPTSSRAADKSGRTHRRGATQETRWSPRTRMQTRSKSYICPNDTLVGHSCGTLL